MRRLLLPFVLVALLVLSGCGSSAEHVTPHGAAEGRALPSSIHRGARMLALISTATTIGPTGLTVVSGTSTLAATWGVTTTSGLGGFLIHWRVPGASSWATAQLGGSARSYTIKGLAEATKYEVQVRALAAAGVTTTTASTTGTVIPEPEPEPTPTPTTATVPALPSGPATPTGGWHLALADGFGAKLGTGTGEDGKWHIAKSHGHNSNELESFDPSQVRVGPEGLELLVSYCAGCTESFGSKKNYLGGQIETNACQTSCANLFWWEPAKGDTWAFQTVTRWPRNTGQMDPGVWATDPSWKVELDFFEAWGWNNFPTIAGGEGEYYAGVPVYIYNTETHSSTRKEIYHPKTEIPNPVSEWHTYTWVVRADNAIETFIDGKYRWTTAPIASSSFREAKMGIILQNALRVDETADFKSGSTPRVLGIRNFEAWNSTGAHYANGGIAPGTTVK